MLVSYSHTMCLHHDKLIIFSGLTSKDKRVVNRFGDIESKQLGDVKCYSNHQMVYQNENPYLHHGNFA